MGNMKPIEEFIKAAGDITILDKPEEREMFSHDIGDVPDIMTRAFFKTQPDFVVQPKSVDEIQKILEFANREKIPVIPRGSASWGFGGVIPTKAGIVVDLSPFRKILEMNTGNKTVTVEAGARWSDIDLMAKKVGLCLMTYPSSKFSTVAGWISTGGYGINSFRYGHLSRQIVSMKVITGAGELKALSPSAPEFNFFVSTEGELGIIVEATLKLRDVPEASYAHLLYFKDDRSAFEFIGRFLKSRRSENLNPNVIRFLDENHLNDTNEVIRAEIFRKSAGVLFEFGSAEDEERFEGYIAKSGIVEAAPRYAARYLWNERLFGMKTKRLGPTILASEIVIPISAAAEFIEEAKMLGDRFGVEICIDSYILDEKKALIMATFLCDSRKKKYMINMPLVSMLTQKAVSLGAEPYGLGLWNAAFIDALYNPERQRALKAYKAKMDPNGILNPGKFFAVDSTALASLVFQPAVFRFSMNLLTLLSPVIGKAATLLFGKDRKIDHLDFELSTHACAKCGNCLAVCPADLITHNEGVTAKGKVALAKKLIEGKEVTRDEAANAFMCMHCKACQEICQTNLELMRFWDALEQRLEGKFGRPEAQIKEFLQKVDKSNEYWEMVERNA
jgi:FAD/FMN-containing dehydrogenase/NAD-dependent dihydropyrimidine dehydrogenase PreA subunit